MKIPRGQIAVSGVPFSPDTTGLSPFWVGNNLFVPKIDSSARRSSFIPRQSDFAIKKMWGLGEYWCHILYIHVADSLCSNWSRVLVLSLQIIRLLIHNSHHRVKERDATVWWIDVYARLYIINVDKIGTRLSVCVCVCVRRGYSWSGSHWCPVCTPPT